MGMIKGAMLRAVNGNKCLGVLDIAALRGISIFSDF
jgi:hypothetical protein